MMACLLTSSSFGNPIGGHRRSALVVGGPVAYLLDLEWEPMCRNPTRTGDIICPSTCLRSRLRDDLICSNRDANSFIIIQLKR